MHSLMTWSQKGKHPTASLVASCSFHPTQSSIETINNTLLMCFIAVSTTRAPCSVVFHRSSALLFARYARSCRTSRLTRRLTLRMPRRSPAPSPSPQPQTGEVHSFQGDEEKDDQKGGWSEGGRSRSKGQMGQWFRLDLCFVSDHTLLESMQPAKQGIRRTNEEDEQCKHAPRSQARKAHEYIVQSI